MLCKDVCSNNVVVQKLILQKASEADHGQSS